MLKHAVKHLKVFVQLSLVLLLISCVLPATARKSNRGNNAKPATTTQKPAGNPGQKSDKPNIILILIDDMGFNDVSFHGSDQILTPNIDALAYNGIILNRYYVPNLCTPSRASLLTGRYPIHTGMQYDVIINDEPWGLPLRERLMPEFFRDAGYSTNLVGKWHLGFWRKEHTPTLRGFDHHYGYYSGYIDYFDHTHHMLNRNYSNGVDFRNDLKTVHEANGTYATELFTREAERIINEHNTEKPLFLVFNHLAVHTGNEDDPMQALPEEVEKFEHISNQQRRFYAGMMSSLDESVGRTMRALSKKGLLDNSVVLIYSDNGAPTTGIHSNSGSNYPFRGQKESPWEGAIRSAGAIWSPLLKQKNYVSQQAIHPIDWLPTLASVAGVPLPSDIKYDGVNIWDSLSNNLPATPRSILHSLDDVGWYSSYMRDNLKYVNGTTFDGQFDGWLGDIPMVEEADPLASFYGQHVLSSAVHEVLGDKSLGIPEVEKLRKLATVSCPKSTEDPNDEIYRCEPLKEACLFDIEADPCERFNLAKKYPFKVKLMQQEIDQFRLGAVEPAKVSTMDPLCDPKRFNGTWQWWYGTGKNGAGGKTCPTKNKRRGQRNRGNSEASC